MQSGIRICRVNLIKHEKGTLKDVGKSLKIQSVEFESIVMRWGGSNNFIEATVAAVRQICGPRKMLTVIEIP